ncbi:MAG: hypothetical protein QM811_23940 [Pirellulales bacterium]
MLIGCQKGPVRQAVVGAVSLDGKPVQQGNINFTPVAGGPSAGGDIVEGRYALEGKRGPGLGKYKVEITAYKKVPTENVDPATNRREDRLVQIVPARYNTATTLERDITADGDVQTLDFELKTKE